MCAISSNHNAAPVGFLHPRAQLAALTVGMFSIAAKPGWLTLSLLRISDLRGMSGLTGCDNDIGAVRRVIFAYP